MKAYERQTEGGAAARQARKKKIILAALAGVTLLTWSRTLLGGEQAHPAAAAPAAGAPLAAAGAPAARSAVRAITSFDQAMDRMSVWPVALERRMLEGAIRDLAPAQWLNLSSAAEEEPHAEAPTPAQTPLAESTAVPAAATPPSCEELPEQLPLRLRSTALLGAHRFAVIGNTRYALGDVVEYDEVRLTLVAVDARSAVLRLGERTWTLQIATSLETAEAPAPSRP